MMGSKLSGPLALCLALGTGSVDSTVQAQPPATSPHVLPPIAAEKQTQPEDNTGVPLAIGPGQELRPTEDPKVQLLFPLPGDGDSVGPGGDGLMGGMGRISPFGNPLVGQAPLHGGYRATWFASEPVMGQPTNLGYVRQEFTVSSPVWQKRNEDEWSVSASVREEFFQTHAILPDTRQAFPEDLWNIRFSTTCRHLFDNGWILGGNVSVGTASDKPFNGLEELTAGINAFLRLPSGEHNAWLFSLSYSPTAQLPFPIPTLAYVWQPSESFRMNIGIPFMLMWQPTENLSLDVSYMLLTTLNARVNYRLGSQMRLYVAYNSESEAYLLADRVESQDRFYDVDQRVSTGAQIFFTKKLSLDLSGVTYLIVTSSKARASAAAPISIELILARVHMRQLSFSSGGKGPPAWPRRTHRSANARV
jgi:hypothetical protein